MPVAIATSSDGQIAVIRRGTRLSIVGDEAAGVELASDAVDLAVVGPPNAVLAVLRAPSPRVVLYTLPELEAAATIELDAPFAIATICGARVVLATADGRRLVVVRVASRALAAQGIDPGATAEFVVGLDKNQLLLGLPKKLEVWDPIAGRPLVRLQLQLPPPPRSVGAALGHVWATRPGSDEVFVYRLSDGRPFRHHVGAPVERAIARSTSPVIVLVTARGLVRLHCFAHSLTPIDSPWTPDTALALHGHGDDVALLGATRTAAWRIALDAPNAGDRGGGSGPVHTIEQARAQQPAAEAKPAPTPAPRIVAKLDPAWRDPLAGAAAAVVRGAGATGSAARPRFELPTLPDDCELAVLARRLALGEPARRALALLYGLSLAGETLSIANLARALDDWTEPLGQGELRARDLVRRYLGGIVLRRVVLEQLDGAPPRVKT